MCVCIYVLASTTCCTASTVQHVVNNGGLTNVNCYLAINASAP